MAFVGQLYSSNLLSKSRVIWQFSFTFATIAEETFIPVVTNAMVRSTLPIQFTYKHIYDKKVETKCRLIPDCDANISAKMYINRILRYDDSIDLNGNSIAVDINEDELPDQHLRDDKIGGLFPYDGYTTDQKSPNQISC